MANTLSVAQLESYQIFLNNGEIRDFYTLMINNGYAYAGWGRGVAGGDTLAGAAALDFLTGTAQIGGIDGSLSTAAIEKIKADMAQAYLDQLIAIADSDGAGGFISRDVSAAEVRDFHIDVFENNDLTIENWTLNAPFTLIQQTRGDAKLEEFWADIRDTEGEGIDAFKANVFVAVRMLLFTDAFYDVSIRSENQWGQSY